MPTINDLKRPYKIYCKDKTVVSLLRGLNKVSEDTLDSLKDTDYFNQLLKLNYLIIEVSKKKEEKKSNKD
jgi:hypothetical protein